MYRLLLPVLLCTSAVTPAPQSKSDSDVTFVKIQPVVEDTAPEVTNKRRESRIENLSLTIPGDVNGTETNGKPNYDTVSDGTSNGKPTYDTVSIGIANGKATDDTGSDGTSNGKAIDDRTSDGKPSYGTSDETDLSVQNTEVSEQKTDLTESDAESENKSDIVTQETQRQGRNYHSSDETTESFEIATEKYEEVTEIQSKKQTFAPKLSYFPKNYDRFSTNLIEKSSKRHFTSRCRCEKIWNCPKLQITVPRCPDEYFLCCF